MTLVWDWNGTLLDDTDAALGALNELLVRRGLPTITLDFYRQTFSFPVRPYYEFLGMDLAREDWDALAKSYHDAYHARPAGLNAEAVAALDLAQAHGVRQVLLSALRQDYLDAAVDRFGLRGYFDFVVGSDNLDGGSKLSRALALKDLLARADKGVADELVFIGDALHDKEVADALGARCVLFSGGGHAAERLAAVAPTAATLTEAVRLATSRRPGRIDPVDDLGRRGNML